MQETLFPPIELVEAQEGGCGGRQRGSSRYSEGQIYEGDDEGLASNERSVGISVLFGMLSTFCQNGEGIMYTDHSDCAGGNVSDDNLCE